MSFTESPDYKAKVAAAKALQSQLESDPNAIVQGLFFAARNGAISHVLREVETFFAARGLVLKAKWKETSMPGTHVELLLKERHLRRLWIDRNTFAPGDRPMMSMVLYALKSVQVGDYYGGRKPKIAEEFDAVLESEAFKAQAESWINGLNYPFAYVSHSSF